jgi:spore germination protein GerM
MKKNSFKKKLLVLYSTAIYTGCILLILSLILFNIGCQPLGDTDTTSDNTSENDLSNSSDIENIAEDTGSGESIAENGNSTDEEESGEETDGSSEEGSQTETEDEQNVSEGELAIKVYYADSQGEYLVGESRTVSSENKYADALYELMKLPVDSSLNRLIPDTTKINSVEVEEGIASVDLSENFVEDRIVSDTVDILLVYSIVNTLTEFPGVNSVTFYIDGVKLDILGELDIKGPNYRKSDLIKN